MNTLPPSPALIIIESHDPAAAAALAYGLGDHFDDSMNRLTAQFSNRHHATPVLNGYEMDEYMAFTALQTALEQTVAIIAAKPDTIEWTDVLKTLSPYCTPALAPILIENEALNDTRAMRKTNNAFADTLVLSSETELTDQKNYVLTFLRHRRGEIARDPAIIFMNPARPRLIRQDDFLPA
jgi:hypothetical protein